MQDATAQISAVTPVAFTITSCPLGYLLVAATTRGLCAVSLGDSAEELAVTLTTEIQGTRPEMGQAALAQWKASIGEYLQGRPADMNLPLDVRATAFQRRVWQALQAIPYGSTRSYSQVAAAIGQPTAVRAVARACATNPVALVVPCHRVVREGGGLSGYRWGIERKAALLALEKRQIAQPAFFAWLAGRPASSAQTWHLNLPVD